MKYLSFSKLSREKRKQLFAVLFATVVVLGGLGYGLVKQQYGTLDGLKKKHDEVDARFLQMDKMVKHAPGTEMELAITSKKLSAMEENMASRDIYSGLVTTLRRFKQPYKNVDIPQVEQPSVGEMNLIPNFPYKQATMKVSGTAYYYDLGRFIADLENQFPQVRVVNLEISPASVANQRGLLSFDCDIITLVNPNPL